FYGTIFKDCNMKNTRVRNAELSYVTIEGGNYQHSSFSEVNMKEAHIKIAYFDKTQIVGSKRHPIEMERTSLEQSTLTDSLIRRANMNNTFLHQVNLSGSTLTHVTMKNAVLDRVDLSNSRIDDLNLKNA